MSSWMDVDLTTVPADNEVLPEGRKFVFELLEGAKPASFDPDRINFSAKVVDGEFAGRVVYASYPNPEKVGQWVKGVFIRMTHALGEPIGDGEHPVDYLNRMAGHHFVAPVKHRQVQQDGVDTIKGEINIGNVSAYRG
jgi:hypothetical protein